MLLGSIDETWDHDDEGNLNMPIVKDPASTSSSGSKPSEKQRALVALCNERGLSAPKFQAVSDRRGGRTAWTCAVTVNEEPIHARNWYSDMNDAAEDAAEVALQSLGVTPTLSHRVKKSDRRAEFFQEEGVRIE